MEILRKYGAATTILFPLIDAGAADFESTPVTFATGDAQISKNEGAFANTSNNPAHEGNGMYSLALTATEMQAARIMITVIDTAPKTWEDQAIIISTYGNASAEHAFDLDTATQSVNVTTIEGSDATDQIRDAVVDDATRIDASALNTLSGHDPGSQLAAQSDVTGLNDPTAAAVADAVWDEAKSGHVAAGSFGEEVQAHALSSEVSALNDPTAAAVADAVWDEAIADHSGTSGSTAEALDAAGGGVTAAAIADAVWEEALADHSGTSGSTAEALDAAGGGVTAAAIADAVWDEAKSGHVASGSFGEEVQAHALSSELPTQMIQVQPLIPHSIVISRSPVSYRLGLMVTNALGDLPSTAELIEGTISILRSAAGEMSWTTIVSDASCSEDDGLIYYDEVFDVLAGYASGDMIQIIFKNQKVSVGGTDYELTGSSGVSFFTSITIDGEIVAGAVWDAGKAGFTNAGSFGEEVQGHALSSELPANFADLDIEASSGRVDVGFIDGSAAGATGLAALGAAYASDNYVEANIQRISGDAAAADNLESQYDGTGYTNGKAPATQEQVDALNDPTAGEVADAVWEEAIGDHSGTSGSTAEALATSGGGATPAAIADAVWDEAKSGHVAAGSFGEEVQAHALSVEIAALNDPTAAAVADAVWDEAKSGHVAGGSFGEEVQAHALSSEISALNDPTAAAVADAVWEEAIADHSGTSGSTAEALGAAGGAATPAAIADAVWGEAIADHSGSPGSTAEALDDASGGATPASIAAAVWQYTVEAGNPVNVQTAEEMVRIMLAALVGADDPVYDWAAKSPGGKTRVGGTLDSSGRRTAVNLLDGS